MLFTILACSMFNSSNTSSRSAIKIFFNNLRNMMYTILVMIKINTFRINSIAVDLVICSKPCQVFVLKVFDKGANESFFLRGRSPNIQIKRGECLCFDNSPLTPMNQVAQRAQLFHDACKTLDVAPLQSAYLLTISLYLELTRQF